MVSPMVTTASAGRPIYDQLLTRKERAPETGRFEKYITVYLQGDLGDDGLSVSPGVKLRRYRSEGGGIFCADYPRPRTATPIRGYE